MGPLQSRFPVENGDNVRPCSGLRPRRFGKRKIKVPPTASGGQETTTSYNIQVEFLNFWCTAAAITRIPTTEKRRRPRPKAGSDVAFNNECCN